MDRDKLLAKIQKEVEKFGLTARFSTHQPAGVLCAIIVEAPTTNDGKRVQGPMLILPHLSEEEVLQELLPINIRGMMETYREVINASQEPSPA